MISRCIHAVVCAYTYCKYFKRVIRIDRSCVKQKHTKPGAFGFFFSSKECPAWKIIPGLGYVVNNLRIRLWDPFQMAFFNGGDPNHLLTGMILQGGHNPPLEVHGTVGF